MLFDMCCFSYTELHGQLALPIFEFVFGQLAGGGGVPLHCVLRAWPSRAEALHLLQLGAGFLLTSCSETS